MSDNDFHVVMVGKALDFYERCLFDAAKASGTLIEHTRIGFCEKVQVVNWICLRPIRRGGWIITKMMQEEGHRVFVEPDGRVLLYWADVAAAGAVPAEGVVSGGIVESSMNRS